jgi:hypothetical protein
MGSLPGVQMEARNARRSNEADQRYFRSLQEWQPQITFDNEKGFEVHQGKQFYAGYARELNDSLHRPRRCGSTILPKEYKSVRG